MNIKKALDKKIKIGYNKYNKKEKEIKKMTARIYFNNGTEIHMVEGTEMDIFEYVRAEMQRDDLFSAKVTNAETCLVMYEVVNGWEV